MFDIIGPRLVLLGVAPRLALRPARSMLQRSPSVIEPGGLDGGGVESGFLNNGGRRGGFLKTSKQKNQEIFILQKPGRGVNYQE